MNKKNKHINLISSFSIILIFVVLFIWCYKTLNKSDKSGGNEVNLDNDYYLVSFDSNGGDGIFDDQKVLKNSFAVRPISEPIYEGYIFLGWYLDLDDVTEFNFNEPIISNIELIAKWEKVNVETYLVKFDSNGGSPLEVQVIEKGEKVNKPDDPIRDGYNFLGWYDGDKLYNFDNEVLLNLILVARWQKNDGSKIIYHTVTFDSNGGGHVGNQIVEDGKKIVIPSMPIYEGYTFLGWYDGNNIFNFNNAIKRDIKLVAKWKKDDGIQVVYYIVSFDSNGGSYVDSQIVAGGEKAAVPLDPMREGYSFVGWHHGSSIFNFEQAITENTILVAGWRENVVTTSKKYTVTFDSNGGENVDSVLVNAGDNVTMPIPTRKWYDFVSWKSNGKDYNFNTPVTDNITLVADWKVSSTIVLVNGVDLIPNTTNASIMKNNTIMLQRVIDLVSDNGGGMVKIPAGTFYFSQGGRASNRLRERYAIKPKNNVHLVGAGTNESNSSQLTVLKPYFTCDNTGNGSMDMFYFNNYSDTDFNNAGIVNINTRRNINYTDIDGNEATLYNQTVYLINADFSNFIIDGNNVHGCSYETDGKGFMINLFKDCDWNNVVVKNTDATGFGMDCPINSTITNCMAVNCGKNATTNSEGASGFGIGVGFANNESITISNSLALNNKKFGFFFEHQARFNATAYTATNANGFVVKNSIAGGNMYDFGGLKAFSVVYTGVKSVSGKNTYLANDSLNITKSNVSISSNNVFPVYFSMYSKNIQLNGDNFSDNVSDIYTNVNQIKWAINNGIIAVSKGTTFSPNTNVTRFEALSSLYKYKNMPGNITVMKTINERIQSQNDVKNIGFTDLGDAKYINDLDVILWGYNAGIISEDTIFRPEANVTRAEFMTMLYRMKGSPNIDDVLLPYNDVNTNSWYYKAVAWGYQNNIMSDITGDVFSSSMGVNKMQMALYLYNFNNL